jgi:hypothetical protein
VWPDQVNSNGTIVQRIYAGGNTFQGSTAFLGFTNLNVPTPRNQFGIWYSVEAVGAPLREWQHVVGTHDGMTQKIYRNGVLFGSMLSDISIDLPGFEMFTHIGMWADYAPYGLKGKLQDVAIYQRALTPQEIVEHRNLRFSGGAPAVLPPKIDVVCDVKTRTLVASDGLRVCCLETVHE